MHCGIAMNLVLGYGLFEALFVFATAEWEAGRGKSWIDNGVFANVWLF